MELLRVGETSAGMTSKIKRILIKKGILIMSCSDPRGSFFDWHGDDFSNILDQLQVGNISGVFGTGEALDNGLGNDDNPLQLYLDRQEGTSQPSNITNAAAATKKEKTRESKRKSREKIETGRKEKVEKLEKQNHDLREVNASLGKEISNLKEEVSRLNNKLEGQTMQKRKLRDSKLTRSMKRIRDDILVNINEGQERIRAAQKEVREKFEEISKDTAKLKEEINIISKQSANQVRLDLMFQIVKARAENDAPKDAALTQILRALINGEAEPELKRAKLPEEKQEQRLITYPCLCSHNMIS